MSTSYVWRTRRGLNSYLGQIGEALAADFLRKEGFKVFSYMFLTGNVGSLPTRDFLGSMWESFIKMNETLNRIYAGSTHKGARFDFIARKEGKYYVVEVKTNKGQLRKSQEEELQRSKRFGFVPMIVRTKVTLIADNKDVTVEYL